MCVWKEKRSESLNVIEDRERERERGRMEFEVWRLEGERRRRKRGRMFFVDDEKKLERIFALAGRAEEKGKEGQGEGVAREPPFPSGWLLVTVAIVTGRKKYAVGR